MENANSDVAGVVLAAKRGQPIHVVGAVHTRSYGYANGWRLNLSVECVIEQ